MCVPVWENDGRGRKKKVRALALPHVWSSERRLFGRPLVVGTRQPDDLQLTRASGLSRDPTGISSIMGISWTANTSNLTYIQLKMDLVFGENPPLS